MARFLRAVSTLRRVSSCSCSLLPSWANEVISRSESYAKDKTRLSDALTRFGILDKGWLDGLSGLAYDHLLL